MIKFFSMLLIIFFINHAEAANKEKIIFHLKKIENLRFDFEQNISGKIEKGRCILKYPKKIYCEYNSSNNKILVSNGRSVVIKTDIGSFYRYPLEETPLSLILDKNFLLNNIENLNEEIVDNKFIIFTLRKNNLNINILLDKNNFNIAGWKVLDIYQNVSLTTLSNITTNQKIKSGTFKLPEFN